MNILENQQEATLESGLSYGKQEGGSSSSSSLEHPTRVRRGWVCFPASDILKQLLSLKSMTASVCVCVCVIRAILATLSEQHLAWKKWCGCMLLSSIDPD